MSLGGKAVLVTGASSGIGSEIVRRLALRGDRIIISARRADRLEALAAELRLKGATIHVAPADLADPDSSRALSQVVQERFGSLDVLINNAGYGLSTLYTDAEADAIRRQVEVNLISPLLLTHALLPLLLRSRGMVINVGSSISVAAIPAYGVYGMTKAALAYWNDTLRRELSARGVRVCLVEPGPVATEFFDVVGGNSTDDVSYWLKRPPSFLTGKADDAARRIVDLIDHPRRRISMLRRAVWLFRAAGALTRLFPWLGDVLMSPHVAGTKEPR